MYNKDIYTVFSELSSSSSGLVSEQAKQRLNKHGENKLNEAKKVSPWIKFLSQFKDLLIAILLISFCVSVFLAFYKQDYTELIDAGFILFVVILNAVIGYAQESKAENALENLKKLTKSYAKVLRNGKIHKIRIEEIVIGDVVVLEAGDIVPADIRLFSVASLKIEESSLTGESVAVEKQIQPINVDGLPINDQTNMAFMGSVVMYGRAKGVVTATGNNTEMGKIAGLIGEQQEERTLLQKRIDKTSKIITIVVLSVCLAIFVAGLFYMTDWTQSFMIAISIAVCAIPEGLPAGVTITMAMGVQKMSKQGAIVRRLAAVETLGTVQIICSDKTGTLTLNKMSVKEIFVKNMNDKDLSNNPNFSFLINAMLLCNDSEMRVDENNNINCIGDPTETALVYYGYDMGYSKDELNGMYPRVNELPFDSERKIMTTLNTVDGQTVAHIKGAVDNLLNLCTHILDNGKSRKLTEQDRLEILQKNSQMANRALRVLAYASKNIVTNVYDVSVEGVENGLTFIGLTAMIDPPREEIYEAIKTCKQAFITPIMITGDHSDTAFAIAKELGIADDHSQVITGKELNELSDEEFTNVIQKYTVFARVCPEHKVRIVNAYKSLDKVVAMTGDGVNDAPSIKAADIGVGMGITGTDVTKSVSDLILTDDNFATIVSAVKEGRTIYSNIMKIIQFLMSTSFAEVIIMGVIIAILGRPFFGPALILWINIVSDTLPALALGVEKPESDIMSRKPNVNCTHLFTGENGRNIIVIGLLQSLVVFSLYFISTYVFNFSSSVVITMSFLTLIMVELFHSYNVRSDDKSIFKIGVFSNKFINFAFIGSFLLTAILIILPIIPVQNALGITSLSFVQWIICIGFGFLIVPIVEIYKLINRSIKKKKHLKVQLNKISN